MICRRCTEERQCKDHAWQPCSCEGCGCPHGARYSDPARQAAYDAGFRDGWDALTTLHSPTPSAEDQEWFDRSVEPTPPPSTQHPIDDMPVIDTEYVHSICRLGAGAACCSFLVMGARGFECGKDSERARAVILSRRNEMVSQGDNCPGWSSGERLSPDAKKLT